MADDYLRTHVIDGSHWCTQDRGKTDIDSQPRIIALRAANSRLVSENDELKRHIQSAREQTGTRVADWISRSDFEELEKHAAELERRLLDMTAERDRLRKWQHESNGKLRTYRREIRRLQRALLAERGKGVTDELERQSRVLAGFQARLEALESALKP